MEDYAMKRNSLTFILTWLVIFLLCLSFLPFPAQATLARSSDALPSLQLEVDTLVDSNELAYQVCSAQPDDCSLRGAISKSNLDPHQLYEISLPDGTYLLSIAGAAEDANASGDLDVRGNLRLMGAGAAQTVIHAQQIDRVFQVFRGASLTLQGVTITGGKTPDGEPGDPGARSDDGGGLHNSGALYLVDSVLQASQTGAGGAGSQETAGGGASGHGGASIIPACWLWSVLPSKTTAPVGAV
jgi:hypothetical protein